MVTSAQTLATIISTLAKKHSFDQDEAITLLAGKGLLPKKMLEAKKPEKVVTKWASKAAEDLAKENGLLASKALVGTGKDGKITVKDVKTHASPAIKKVNASPSALKWARDHDIDISKIASGSGKDGKICLKDVQDLGSDSDSYEDDMPALSPTAAKLVKRYDLDADDLADIEGSGKDGKICAKDLEKLVKEIEDE